MKPLKKSLCDKHRKGQHKKNDDPIYRMKKQRVVNGAFHRHPPIDAALFGTPEDADACLDLTRIKPLTTSPKTMKPNSAINTIVTQLVKFQVMMMGSATTRLL
jgi:hypothetical protein